VAHGLLEFQAFGFEFGAGQIAGDRDRFTGSQVDGAEGVGKHKAVPAVETVAPGGGEADGGNGHTRQAGELNDARLDHLPRSPGTIGGNHGMASVFEPMDEAEKPFRSRPEGGAAGGVDAEAFHYLGDVFAIPAAADDHCDLFPPDMIDRDHDPAVPEGEEKGTLLLLE